MEQLPPAEIDDVLHDQLDSLIEHAAGAKHSLYDCRDCARFLEVKQVLMGAFTDESSSDRDRRLRRKITAWRTA
jgi:hypothetical protein